MNSESVKPLLSAEEMHDKHLADWRVNSHTVTEQWLKSLKEMESQYVSQLQPSSPQLEQEVKRLQEENERLSARIKELEQQLSQSPWEEASEKPEEGLDVLVHMAKFGKAGTPNGDYTGYYENGKWVVRTSDGEDKDAENNPDYWFVTHWMLLPPDPFQSPTLEEGQKDPEQQ